MNKNSNSILRRQRIIFIFIISVVFIICFGFIYHIFGRNSTSPVRTKPNTDLPVDKVDPQTIVMSRIEGENKILNQRLKYIEDLFLENKQREEKKDIENEQLRKEIVHLKTDLKQLSSKQSLSIPKILDGRLSKKLESKKDPLREDSSVEKKERFLITEIVSEKKLEKVHHVDCIIPAGTSVKALLVSSVDAPCGVNSSSDPQPVKLRILDDGHLPKNVRARLKGGLIIASVYGDLSNERVYMRLERLSQIKSDGTFIETGITGFVTGEDGKYGVRGCVVDKSCKLVGNAALSGLFSGISSSLQSAVRAKNYNVYENSPALSPLSIGTDGGVRGASNAFDMLTDYFIKRAEQIRPVIQVGAGRMVDITFTHSAPLGDLYTQEYVKEIRNGSREK